MNARSMLGYLSTYKAGPVLAESADKEALSEVTKALPERFIVVNKDLKPLKGLIIVVTGIL
jgi:hypothetical protein